MAQARVYCISVLTPDSRCPVLDTARFRAVLGHFPSGVTAITSHDARGRPVGMTVASFTSVSLAPPLVAFLPGKTSSTFPVIAGRGTFCVNVLATDQEWICRALSVSGGDKFAEVPWRPGPHGDPVIDGAVAWIGRTIEAVHDAGDHRIVIGRVDDLDADSTASPLLFFQSRYNQLVSA
ncbi:MULTISPECIES: flavin reductase family protein [Streptomyces]|uniref:flavin reductase family protein n=1 Tax=Streptomyces TaxID=1883 RepID=UPI001FF49848|nr:flavin reductase family protein [Streptomyces sp. AgN23]WTA86407.1 flavin reductase family protein [Streptomyces antimycoticus]WTB03038.1 flavin reductase family protein [Streptomyces antimycoticus]